MTQKELRELISNLAGKLNVLHAKLLTHDIPRPEDNEAVLYAATYCLGAVEGMIGRVPLDERPQTSKT